MAITKRSTPVNSGLLNKPAAYFLFVIPPLAVLFLMNGVMDAFVQDIGNTVSQKSLLSERYKIEISSQVAVSQGRFKFAAFFMTATVLYLSLAVYSVAKIWQNLSTRTAVLVLFMGAAVSIYWIFNSSVAAEDSASAGMLFEITRNVALKSYDYDFASKAYAGARLHFALALIATILAALAGACIMCGVYRNSKIAADELMRKRGELRLLLCLTSVFLTFVAVYVSQWMAWPANFVESLPKDSTASPMGKAQEILSLASEVRLFFGAGYALTLVAFAVPAAIVFSECAKSTQLNLSNAAGSGMRHIFDGGELGAVASVIAPVVVPLLGSALGI